MEVTRWIKEVSPTLYAEPLRFDSVFWDFYNQQENHILAQSLRARFAIVEDMENYFNNQDQEKTRRMGHMRGQWNKENNNFNSTMNECMIFYSMITYENTCSLFLFFTRLSFNFSNVYLEKSNNNYKYSSPNVLFRILSLMNKFIVVVSFKCTKFATIVLNKWTKRKLDH